MLDILIQRLPPFVRSKFEGRDNLQKILSNFGWLLIDRVLRMGFGLVVGVWVARYLGPQQFGLYNYAMAFAGLFGPLASLGLDSIVVRDIVRHPERKNEILGTAFALKLTAGSLTLLLTLITIYLLRPNDSLGIWIVGIMSAGYILQAFDTIDFWFQSQLQSKYTVWAKNTAFIIGSILKIVLIQTQASLIAFVWLGLIELTLGAIGLVISYRSNKYNFKNWRPSLFLTQKLLKDSYPLILSGVAIMIYMKIDQIMLGEMLGDKAVGVYSAAVKVSELWYFMPVAISSSVTPVILKAREISQQKYYEQLQKTFYLMVNLSYLVSIPITFLSPTIILTLFGKDYVDSIQILSIHIWASVFVFLGVIRGIWIIAENLTMISFITALLGAVINVLLNLYLIPAYQGVGAAIATVIAYAVPGYFVCLIYPPLKPIGKLMTNALILNGVFKGVKSKFSKI